MKTYKCDNCQMKIEAKKENELDQKHPTTCPHCGEEALIEERKEEVG